MSIKTKKLKQSEQKLLEILSDLTEEDRTFLREYFDKSESLDIIFSVIERLTKSQDSKLTYQTKVKKAVLIVDETDPTELVDLYVDKDNFKFLCGLFGSNRVTVALRIKGIG